MSKATSRSMLKAQYERFKEAWNNEKTFQKYLLESGKELPEGHNKLTKKPTFAMWLQAVKNKKLSADVNQAPPVEDDTKKVEVTDTEW